MTDGESKGAVVVSAETVVVPSGIDIRPAATPAEVAAILVAYAELWPKPAPGPETAISNDWRFAGRWWRAAGPGARPPIRR
jgi:hypothetical protein